MNRNTIAFTYDFSCVNGDVADVTVTVRLDAETLDEIRDDEGPLPEWTRLSVARCDVCPLDCRRVEHCPAALSLKEQVAHFAELVSFAEVDVTVAGAERTYRARTTAQKALRSLAGLKMATCGCPVLAKFKPMARFHLPFATLEETVFRSASAYLLGQYFVKKRGGKADLDMAGLRRIYEDIHAVNIGLSNRLRMVSPGDANVNALVLLDLFTHEMPQSIEANLASVEPIFVSFFG